MSGVGLQAEWHIMNGDPDFFTITKLFHNALQGMDIPVTSEMKMKYLSVCGENASDCGQDYDFVIVHDPQPCALFAAMKDRAIRRGKWIWRCHIDSTFAQDDAWEFLVPYINLYDGAVFTMQSFVKSQLEVPCLAFIPPSIDPLSAKNIIPEKRVQSDIARRYSMDETSPIMQQISRFDPWKDPLGLVDC